MRRGECIEREKVFLGLLEQAADLRDGGLQTLDHLSEALARLGSVLGGEKLPQGRGDETSLGGAAVLLHCPDEVHGAALPRTRQDPLDRVLEALVLVGDRETDSLKAAGPERAQELNPERL